MVVAIVAGALAAVSPQGAEGHRAPVQLGARVTGAPMRPVVLDDYAKLVGRRPRVVMWYQDWQPDWSRALIVPAFVDAVTDRGAVPMITWEPWLADGAQIQPDYALRQIVRGRHDRYIRRAAREAAAYGRPFYLRFGHEMNGDWSSWGAGVNGNEPTDYVEAWRHVWMIFRSEGADNVRWTWTPNVVGGDVAQFEAYYPGDPWVDWVGLDGYNWGSIDGGTWQSLAEVFGPSYDRLTALTTKPVMIAETGSAETGGDKAAWIHEGLTHDLHTRLPRVRVVVWFNRRKERDWRVNSSAAAVSSFRQAAASSLFEGDESSELRPALLPLSN